MMARDQTLSTIIAIVLVGLFGTDPCSSQMDAGLSRNDIVAFIDNLFGKILKGSEINYISDFQKSDQMQVLCKREFIKGIYIRIT